MTWKMTAIILMLSFFDYFSSLFHLRIRAEKKERTGMNSLLQMRTRVDLYLYPILRAQINACLRDNLLVVGNVNVPLLSEGGQEQDPFHPCKRFADTDARSGTKGKVSMFGT